MHPRALCCAHHVGHWQHGAVGKADGTGRLSPGTDADLAAIADRDIPDNLWWSKDAGGPGNGVHINDALPVNPSPLVGGQNWFDNVATIKKL